MCVRGKYYIVVSGEVAAVKSSIEAGKAVAESLLIDSMVIPNVDPQVAPAIAACTMVDRLNALGIMETYSLCAAVHAADAAVKAAEVDLLEVRLGRGLGGKSFILLTGEVAAVQSAVKAAEALEETQGLMAKSSVIPSPHPDMLRAIG
jgi:microcompartment protein CcmL/EutN